MPVGKTRSNTGEQASSNPSPANPLPTQQEFHQRLRQEALGVMRQFLEKVMREELEALLGCQWGEHTPTRRGQRNGFYERDLGTSNGQLKGLKVPRDRQGQYQTQVFDQYRRYQPQIEEGLTEMFVAGVSTAKVGAVAQTLMGVAPSKSAVSRLNADLSQQFEEWRNRTLGQNWQVIYLDGVYFKVRHSQEAVSMPLLVALGVDQEGHKEVLGLRASAEESKPGWQLLLEDLKQRGVEQVALFVSDGSDGLLAALGEVFPSTPRQRCWLHIQRAVTSAIPKGERGKLWAELSSIWQQPTLEAVQDQLTTFKVRYEKLYPEAVRLLLADKAHLFTFYGFEARWHKFMRTTNAIETLFSNVRTRTDSIEVFTTEESCQSIVWAALMAIKLARIPV